MDSAEAPKEFSLEDPVIAGAYERLKQPVVRHFAESWLTRGPFPTTSYTFGQIPNTGPLLRIHRHHLEMLIAHMRLRGEA